MLAPPTIIKCKKKNRKHPHQHQHKTLTKSFPYEFYEFDPFFHALRHPASQPLISAVIVPLLTDCCACVYVIVSPVILYHRVTTFREMSKHIFRFFFPPAILLALPYCTLLEIKKIYRMATAIRRRPLQGKEQEKSAHFRVTNTILPTQTRTNTTTVVV